MTGEEESTVMVDAIVSAPECTVGAAIEILEAKLASKGIEFKVPPFTRKSEKGKVDGEILRLPTLIHLGIIHGIDKMDAATEQSIGKPASPGEALVPGNVIALYFHGGSSFLRICNERADFGGRSKPIDELPLEWDSERFLVVDAGNGNIAFYSPSHRRFLGCKNGKFSGAGYPIVNINESPRANETFEISICDNLMYFRLRCPIEGAGILNIKGVSDLFRALQICGFE